MRAARQLGACLLVALCACNPQSPKPAASPSPSPAPAVTPPPLHITGHGTAARPVRETLQIHNRIEYQLVSKSFESRGAQGKTRAVFADAQVTFYDRNGTTMTASAPQAILDQTNDSVTMLGGVHAKTSGGMTLECTRLVYDHAAGKLHGQGNVVVTDPKGFRGTGSSFDSDISLSHMRMQ